jgi:hypothetical protein
MVLLSQTKGYLPLHGLERGIPQRPGSVSRRYLTDIVLSFGGKLLRVLCHRCLPTVWHRRWLVRPYVSSIRACKADVNVIMGLSADHCAKCARLQRWPLGSPAYAEVHQFAWCSSGPLTTVSAQTLRRRALPRPWSSYRPARQAVVLPQGCVRHGCRAQVYKDVFTTSLGAR